MALWGDMTAAERLAAKVNYFDFNYGRDHPLAACARNGDLIGFCKAGAHLTQNTDIVACDIIDAYGFERRRAEASPFNQVCMAVLLEAGWQLSRRDMADYYHHNRLGRAPLYSRAYYAAHAVIR